MKEVRTHNSYHTRPLVNRLVWLMFRLICTDYFLIVFKLLLRKHGKTWVNRSAVSAIQACLKQSFRSPVLCNFNNFFTGFVTGVFIHCVTMLLFLVDLYMNQSAAVDFLFISLEFFPIFFFF